MKDKLHVFIVHNFITYIICKSTIDFYKIDKKDFIILTFRNFKEVDDNLNPIPYPFPDYNSNEFEPSINFFKGWVKLYKFDKMVKKLTSNRSFKLYLLGFANIRSFYAFSSHKNCIGYSYIEEGAISFNTFGYFKNHLTINYSTKYKILNYLNFKGRTNGKTFHFYYKEYQEAYCISKDAFILWKRKVLLPISDTFKNKTLKSNINHLLILEGLVKAGYGSKNDYYKLIDKFVDYCKKNSIQKVLYKHHPSYEYKAEMDNYLHNFKDVNFIKLSDNISLEVLALANPSLSFYGTISSVLIYAKIFEAKANSMALAYENIIGKKFSNIPEYLKKIPQLKI